VRLEIKSFIEENARMSIVSPMVIYAEIFVCILVHFCIELDVIEGVKKLDTLPYRILVDSL